MSGELSGMIGDIVKKVINELARTVTFTFTGLEPVVFCADDLSAANRDYAVLHGMAARIGDSAALTKSAENGFTVTEKMRRVEVAAMTTFYANADNADWNMRVSGPKKSTFNPQIQALAEAMGKSYGEAAVWYNETLTRQIEAFNAAKME